MARNLTALIRDNRGNAVIEFAFVLPMLLMLCFGITEFGRAWMTMNIITSAAREGVRLAAVTAPDVNAVTTRVNNLCAAARVVPSAIVVTPPDPADPNRRVSVQVSTDFVIIPGQFFPRVAAIFGATSTFSGTIPLTTTSIMRHEGV
jgi:Flp pilus assembly protein TadG